MVMVIFCEIMDNKRSYPVRITGVLWNSVGSAAYNQGDEYRKHVEQLRYSV